MTNTVSPLRIVHYVPTVYLEQGGVVRAILDWCGVFAARGHQVSLVVYQPRDVPEDWLAGGPGLPRAYIVPKPLPPIKLLGWPAMRMVDQLLQDADVLHLHGPWLDGNRQIANLARRRGVPYLLSTHGMLDDWSMARRTFKKRAYMTLFGRRMLNRAAAVHCTAEAELAQSSKWFSNSKTVVLPCLVNLAPFETLPGPESALQMLPAEKQSKPRILFLSRLHEQKGVDILIQAAGLLRDAGTDFVCLLAGTGEARYVQQLQAMVNRLNLQEHVLFLGLITGQKKLSLYEAADLFVLPTQHENFGLVLIEAMACGKPVLTTKGTDIWQQLQSAGAVIAENTPAVLAEQIQKLLNDPIDRVARGVTARKWVNSTLAMESLSLKYETLYHKIKGIIPFDCAENKGDNPLY